MIPREAAAEIEKHCNAGEFDLATLKNRTEAIGYPVLPVVEQLVGLCANGFIVWVQGALPTQDITDTATVLQIRKGLALVEDDLNAICESLAAPWQKIP